MASLQIVLKKGFADDTVRVEVNGRTVIDESNVATKSPVEVALMRDIQVDGDSAYIAVSVPSRGTTSAFTVPLSGTASVEISLNEDGEIERRPSPELVRVM